MSTKDHHIASLYSLRTLNNLLSYFLFKSDDTEGSTVPRNTYLSVSGNGFRSKSGGSMMDGRDGDENCDGGRGSTLGFRLPTSMRVANSNSTFTFSKDSSQTKSSLKWRRHVSTIFQNEIAPKCSRPDSRSCQLQKYHQCLKVVDWHKIILPKYIFIIPFWKWMNALAVTKNDRPKITATWLLGIGTGSMSKIMHFTGKMNLLI